MTKSRKKLGRSDSQSVTIKEVANKLGVSPATVSRALARPELLRTDTRKRVLDAVERLGYQPNLIARDLRLQKTHLVFVVVPTLSPFFLEVFRGVERSARENSYAVLMGHTERDSSREHRFLDQAASGRADGVILVTSSDSAALANRRMRMPPSVVALAAADGTRLPTVRVDHRLAAINATNHLLALGHRRIAHIAGPEGQTIAAHRRDGFNQAMLAAGLDPTTYPCLAGPYAVPRGESAMETLLTCNPRPTAVFAGNDELAVGAIQAIKRVGLRVGKDISIIGVDDQRIASLYEPPITTIRVPTEELGYRAMQMLVDVLRGKASETDLLLPTSLVIRATTGPAM